MTHSLCSMDTLDLMFGKAISVWFQGEQTRPCSLLFLPGDCWFLAAVANLTMYPQLFQKVVQPGQGFGSGYCGMFQFKVGSYLSWDTHCQLQSGHFSSGNTVTGSTLSWTIDCQPITASWSSCTRRKRTSFGQPYWKRRTRNYAALTKR